MDIFKQMSKQAMRSYVSAYVEKHGKPEFYHLERKRISVELDRGQENVVTAENRELIYGELIDFYRMAGDGNPLNYFSKLDFVLQHRETNDPIWSKELLLRLISDRCLLFYEHRRYACSDGGLYTLVERERNQKFYGLLDNDAAVQEFEPMTPIHMDYYKEYQYNYRTLTSALDRRRRFTRQGEAFLKELNKLGRRCKTGTEEDGRTEQSVQNWSGRISDVARTYISSVIWQTGKKEYKELFERIFVRKEQDAVEVFQKGTRQIAKCIILPEEKTEKWEGIEKLHCFAPLVLYFIFTRNTKALLEGNIQKLWSNVFRCSKAVQVSAMTELTGRKAGVNLALYCELLDTFRNGSEGLRQLLQRMGISDELSLMELDNVKVYRDTMDFIFNLTTGYGMLFHHRVRYEQIKKSLSEIYGHADDREGEWSVFQYSPDYRHPVDELRYLVRTNIEACFANRVEFLTPGVYTMPSRFELAKLADLVLQDMSLPSAERLSRLIQKAISESSQILDEYQPFLCEFNESGAVTECLDKIMGTYFSGLEGFMERYLGTEVQRGNYDYRHIFRAMVEYEIRHRLYKEGINILMLVAEKVFEEERYLFVIGL